MQLFYAPSDRDFLVRSHDDDDDDDDVWLDKVRGLSFLFVVEGRPTEYYFRHARDTKVKTRVLHFSYILYIRRL